LDHLQVSKAHVVGLSMGGFATLHFGLRHGARASCLVVAGCGYGAPKGDRERFQAEVAATADRFEHEGTRAVTVDYVVGPTRVQHQNKDPRGWAEFNAQLAEHSNIGSALTMRGVQAKRPSVYDLEARLKKLTVPTLIVTGDEDEPCLDASLWMKRTIPSAGLWMAPRTGHNINLEEAQAFNDQLADFFAQVENGRWTLRDPRSLSKNILSLEKKPARAKAKAV
jgi:pimeloyl-ACP methyl ester carboxylesterase